MCKNIRNRGSQRRLLPDFALFTGSFALVTAQIIRAADGLDWIPCSPGLISFAVGLRFIWNPPSFLGATNSVKDEMQESMTYASLRA